MLSRIKVNVGGSGDDIQTIFCPFCNHTGTSIASYYLSFNVMLCDIVNSFLFLRLNSYVLVCLLSSCVPGSYRGQIP